jgi:hypothetical protein
MRVSALLEITGSDNTGQQARPATYSGARAPEEVCEVGADQLNLLISRAAVSVLIVVVDDLKEIQK